MKRIASLPWLQTVVGVVVSMTPASGRGYKKHSPIYPKAHRGQMTNGEGGF
jgi:hypothetical protein